MNTPETAAPPPKKLLDRRGRVYTPAVGPRLKVLLHVIFACVALLGATGVYLVAIRLMEVLRQETYTNQFTIAMFMAHVLVGVFLVLPFLFFGFVHLASSYRRKNRLAVRLGILLFLGGILVALTGLALIQLTGLPQLPTGTLGRNVVYFLHVLTPLAAVVLYVLHRRAGPDIQWRWGLSWGIAVGLFVVVMAGMHSLDPRQWNRQGPVAGEAYFLPAAVHTSTGDFIPAQTLMMDDYCLKCHQDIYHDWLHSAHHNSSFSNPAYLFSVAETRQVALQRDGNVQASRWCAGCHDVVPFVSGAFEDPRQDPKFNAGSSRDQKRLEQFQEVEDVLGGKRHARTSPVSTAGITCTVCHAMTHIDSTTGNGAYTIEEPLHYPFATSQNTVLQWLNNQVVKAKPDFHKKTFLKPFHRTAEFCSTCHKVSIPMALNHYKEFLRGQNHYDTFLLSGVDHGARSFYYPPQSKTRCAECHMPLHESRDFGSRDFDHSGTRKVHNHLFPGANTGLPWLMSLDPEYQDQAAGLRQAAQVHADFLKDKQVRIDLFGLRQGEEIAAPLLAPLRPELPPLQPGKTYLVEVVVRTLGLGHPLTQGTVDSNEVWVDFTARSGGRIIGRSGALDGAGQHQEGMESGRVDEWSHFINVLMLDRNGQRINRRNPQDIFTPLYDHQIPPGAGQVVHYRLDVPADVRDPVTLEVRVRYRKFDFEYMSLVYGGPDRVPPLPIVDLCADKVTLPIAGQRQEVPGQTSPIQPAWQRWNDYGIGLFLTASSDPKKPGLRQAEEAFHHLTTLDDRAARANGQLNLARVYNADARLDEAEKALAEARELGAPWWTVDWFNGLVSAQNYHFDDAIHNFEEILDPAKQPQDPKRDFTEDYVVLDELGKTYFQRAQQLANEPEQRDDSLRRAVDVLERTLRLDSEDLDAHYYLGKCYSWLGSDLPEVAEPATAEPTEPAGLLALARTLADSKAGRETRLQAGVQLGRGLVAFGRQPTQPTEPKMPALREVRRLCREVYTRPETSAELRTMAAHVLGHVHREMHAIYKPDDNAQDAAVSIYRAKHPAARQASFAVVIYPTAPTGSALPSGERGGR